MSNPNADVVMITEGSMDGRIIGGVRPTRRDLSLSHVWKLVVGAPGDLGFGERRKTGGRHRTDEES